MTPKSVLAAGLLLVVAGTWWWVLSGPAFRALPAAASAAPREPAVPIEPPRVALERLARPAATALSIVGDPFAGRTPLSSSRDRVAALSAPPETALALDGAAPQLPPSWPSLSLIGVSTRTTAQGVERVAVLSGERGIIHARVGDAVASVYRVERVGADAVELTLVPENRALTLRLR